MKYQSEIIAEIVEKRGHEKSSLHYESECKETWIKENEGAYPKLTDYEGEWLNYINENPIGEFPYQTLTDVTQATVENVVPYTYKSAILSGQTLVNLAIEKGIVFTGADQWKHLRINQSLLDSSKKYLISFDSSHDFKGYVHLRDAATNHYITDAKRASFKQGNNKVLIDNFSETDLNAFSSIKITFWLDSASVVFPSISNIILLEYVDGMENWDIPYFEGMQSVKMPVLTTTGKNLFDVNLINEELGNNSYIDENNKLVVTGSGANKIPLMKGKFKEKTSYTLSYTFENVDTDVTRYRLQFRYTDGTIRHPSQTIQGNGNATLTTDNEKTIDYIWFTWGNEASKPTTFSNIQLEENSTKTPYEPYQTNILTVNEEVELRGIGDVKDELDCLTGELTERIGEVVLDGSQTAYLISSTANHTKFVFDCNAKELAQSLCDKLNRTFDVGGDVEGYFCGTRYFRGSNDLLISIATSKIGTPTVEDLNRYLSKNPITVQYELETESVKTVDLTTINENGEQVRFKPIEGTMHISTSGETIKPTFSGKIPVEAITQNLASFIEEE